MDLAEKATTERVIEVEKIVYVEYPIERIV
jgi:hypothetical protein